MRLSKRSIARMLSILVVGGLGLVSSLAPAKPSAEVGLDDRDCPEPQGNIVTNHYICYRAAEPLTIDGKMDDASWEKAPWSSDFIDIVGDLKPKPRFKTRVKMLWDDEYFYIAAELEEPHVWAYLTERDTIVCYDNDFEVFIDTDGDTHRYFEYEMNARNVIWDLLVPMPYRDGVGTTVDAWNILGMKTAVHVRGTLNDPSDTDEGWTVELAFPMRVMVESWYEPPRPRRDGEQWRLNFSRVEYEVKAEDGLYVKTGTPCDNWTWSNQGYCNMHYPEMWGILQFSTKTVGEGESAFIPHEDDHAANGVLRQIYYREKQYWAKNGKYTTDLEALGIDPAESKHFVWPPTVQTTDSLFEAFINEKPGENPVAPLKRWHIRQDGKTWQTGGPRMMRRGQR